MERLIEETKPDLVFVAGDLSDPHGTHRTCKAAVERALERYQGQQPEVWLYRGAWQEWSLTEADVLVPLSQDELNAKILAIFRHPLCGGIGFFIGNRISHFGRTRIVDENNGNIGRTGKVSQEPIVSVPITEHPSTTMKIHYRG